MDILLNIFIVLIGATGGYFVASFCFKAVAPAPVATPEPKIFGLEGFENLVSAIPATADASAQRLAVDANTSLIVGFLGYKDEVVQQAEEAIGEKAVAIRQNAERVASLEAEISEIKTSVAETMRESAGAQARIDRLAELKKLKTS